MLSEFENKFFTLVAEHVKLRALSSSLENNLEKTNALSASVAAYSHVVKEVAKQAQAGANGKKNLDILLELIRYCEKAQQLTSNSLQAFEALDVELKRNKRFLLLALMSGVDGRLLTYASPFVMFNDEPQGEQQFDNWYKTAEFDDVFFSLASGLDEHSFYGLWSNPKIEDIVADGYKKFDLWENESAWVSAAKNPRFLRYHDDLSLGLIMEELEGTAVEQTLKSTIRIVSSDLLEFATTILPDYFNIMDLKQVENQFNIKFNDVYLELIGKSDEQLPALHNHDQSEEIYSLTDLKGFEAIIRFIVSHGK